MHLIICGTCLNHYNLADKVQVGVVGGMTDIIEAQWRADKVITLQAMPVYVLRVA